MMVNLKQRKVNEVIIAGVISLIYVFSVLLFSGTLFSGYHLVDDHEILSYVTAFQNGTYSWKTIFTTGIFDYFAEGIRFRPLYITLRLLRSWFFGTNYIAWYITVGMEVVSCLILAYCIVRKMGGRVLQAGLVSTLIVTGEQSEIWWRLGPQEPTGLLCCLWCMLAIKKYEESPKLSKGLGVVLASFLMAASKESFTILLPSMGLFCIACDFLESHYHNLWDGIKKTFKKNIWIFLGMFLIFCINIYVIVYKVGLLSIGYAGIDREAGVSGYIIMIQGMLKWDSLRVYEGIFGVSVILLLISLICGWRGKQQIEKTSFVKKIGKLLLGLTMLSIVMGQLVLYARSGMSVRYLIPASVGFIFFVFHVMLTEMSNKYCRGVLMGVGYLTLIFLYLGVWQDGRDYALQGRLLNNCFATVEKDLEREDNIIICINDETNNSFALYVDINLGMKHVYSWNEEMGFYSLSNIDGELGSFEEAKCIILPDNMQLSDYEIEENDYSCTGSMGYGLMYLKKG
ncbi:MAG TPA: hypothetical protein H9717_11445 [Candidatus Eisenbergiella merdipullorum]|uniref:Uncharacterized protein n=1 Tax=Candidatus Eisenbergiella merdipullorum TaxID=2838553 RepID=A0A9D2L1T9_9FIRM|nr:hypothetical protein [Candidatus Eisenbergiella merdipullorum]